MENKAKIIATLGPSIFSENKLKNMIDLGVDAFRINFSHNTNGIGSVVSKIRKIEKTRNKKIAIIADLQGIKLRVGNLKHESEKIKYNQKFTFDTKKEPGTSHRISFLYPKIISQIEVVIGQKNKKINILFLFLS